MQDLQLIYIQELCRGHKVIWKDHATKRMKQRNIKSYDVEHSMETGEIIEQYPEDYPASSCLILGSSRVGEPLHVVCSIYQDYLCIITAYFPNPNDWEIDMKTRKVVQ